jgi:hypothetical protein
MNKLVKTTLIAAATLTLLGACDMKRNEQPKFGTLARTLFLVDAQGTRFGSVEMDPVTGGKLYDAEGRMIGTIVTPAVTSTVTTTTPVVNGAY